MAWERFQKAVKIVVDPEHPVIVETGVVKELEPEQKIVKDPESESEVVESKLEVEKVLPWSILLREKWKNPLIEPFVVLSTDPIIKLLSFWPAMKFPPDMCDHFQIFLQKTDSQEIYALVCGLIFSGAELLCYVARILFELPSIAASLSRKSISPPPTQFSHDASMLIF